MYYKIENKECEVYKKLHAMRSEELRMEEENRQAIIEKAGSSFERFLGSSSQQTFTRLQQYHAFQFLNPENIDTRAWRTNEEYPGFFFPNKRTQQGRVWDEYLRNGLQKSFYTKPLEILGLVHTGKFVFPFVEISNDIILLYLDDKHEPQDENVVEITKRELTNLFTRTWKST